MSSKRLPGKMLRHVQGKPLLAYVVERLRRCRELAEVVVATSTAVDDDAIAAACGPLGVSCRRGPLDDVIGRFITIIDAGALPAVVRISGDSPLIDPAIVDRAVRLFRDTPCDLVTNVAPRSFPRGQSVEVASSKALRAAAASDLTPDEREHVTLWFYRHPQACSIENFSAPTDLSSIQMSVDTSEDLAAFDATIAAMRRPHWEYALHDILALRQKLAHQTATSASWR